MSVASSAEGLEPIAAPAPALDAFDPSAVRIHSGRYEAAQSAAGSYLLSLDINRLLAPMRREAGLPMADHTGAPTEPYPNWESTGLDGHMAGHALSAYVAFAQTTDLPEFARRAASLVRGMRECQEHMQGLMRGFIGGVPGAVEVFQRIGRGEVQSQAFSLNGAWVPLYNVHKTFAGLLDAWSGLSSIDPPTASMARSCVVDLANWWCRLTATIDDALFARILVSEFGGLCESFAELYARTGNERYLDMAHRLTDSSVFDPLSHGVDALTGQHANTQIPKALGWQRIGALTHERRYADAVETFWRSVALGRSVSIGAHSVAEHFHDSADFGPMVTSEQGPETCNSYNMAKLTARMWLQDPRREYLDFYERIMCNHILSTVSVDEPGFVYFTPMRPRHYRVYSSVRECFWCCVGSGLENHARYGRLIYAKQGGGPLDSRRLLINLFIGSSLQWRERGLHIKQRVHHAADGSLLVTIALRETRGFRHELRLGVREPQWAFGWSVEDVQGGTIAVDADDDAPEGFRPLRATWTGGMEFTVRLTENIAVERLPDGSDWASIIVGNTVMALRDGHGGRDGENADSSRMGHIAQGEKLPLADLPVLCGNRPPRLVEGSLRVEALMPDGALAELTLEPFAAMDRTRYSVYLPIARDESDAARVRAGLMRLDEERREHAAGIVDEVECGRQQSEVGHQYRGRADRLGRQRDVHWRCAQLCGVFSYIMALTRDRCTLHVEIMKADCDCDYAVFMNDMPLERTQRCTMKDSSRVIDVYAVPQCDPPGCLHEAGDAGACARFSLSATATTCGPRVTALRVVTSS